MVDENKNHIHPTIQYIVEAPITDHLRDFAPNLEKYKAM